MRPGRRRLLLVLAGLAGLNLAAYLVFTLPRSMQQRNLGSRLAIAREEVERERARTSALKARFDLLGANTRDTNEFYNRRVAVRGASMVPLLREVEQLARDHGLSVGGQQFDHEPVKGVPLERFVLKMPVTGSYRSLVAFVEELERSRHFVTLDQIDARGQQSGEAQLQMVLSCYFRGAGRSGT